MKHDLRQSPTTHFGGPPEFRPEALRLCTRRADHDEAVELAAMIEANLIAERVAVESYRRMMQLIADKDPATHRLLAAIVADEERHAEELQDWMSRHRP